MSLKTKIINLHNSISMPLKMVILTIVVSLSVWVVLDYLQTSKLKNIYHEQLTRTLNNNAMESRLSFHSNVDKFQATTRLFVIQKRFSDYIQKQEWATADNSQIMYNRQHPSWFPNRSMIRTFTEPRHALLLDAMGRVREVYNSQTAPVPPALLDPSQLLIQKSHDQILMTRINDIPYAISSEPYLDPKGELLATLILATPIDNVFLNAALSHLPEDHMIALLTDDENPRILTSCDLEELPVGTPVSDLKDIYLITGKEFLDYGASEIQMRLAQFVPLAKIENMTNASILIARQDSAMTGFTLILIFTLIIYWITRHITNISKSINNFSQHTLGMKSLSIRKGDQLYILKENFNELTKEIVEARETIKSQSEEKTRLIVNSAFDAIVTTDDSGIISTWNPTAGKLFGWTSEEAIGRPIFDVIIPPQLHEECRVKIKKIIDENMDQEQKCQVILNAYHRNGRKMSIEFSISSAMQEKSSILIFIMRDTTERSRAEKRIHHLLMTLKKSKDEWEKTFDTVTEQILLIDKDLNIIRGNKSFAKSMKSSYRELIGKKFYEFMRCDETWLSAIKEGKEQPERIEINTYDGRWLYISVMPVYDKHALFLYTIITATDITELKKTQQNLMESKQELDERVNELENFYDMAVNRELKMVKLKKEVQKLAIQNGNGTKEEEPQEAPDKTNILDLKTSGQRT